MNLLRASRGCCARGSLPLQGAAAPEVARQFARLEGWRAHRGVEIPPGAFERSWNCDASVGEVRGTLHMRQRIKILGRGCEWAIKSSE